MNQWGINSTDEHSENAVRKEFVAWGKVAIADAMPTWSGPRRRSDRTWGSPRGQVGVPGSQTAAKINGNGDRHPTCPRGSLDLRLVVPARHLGVAGGALA